MKRYLITVILAITMLFTFLSFIYASGDFFGIKLINKLNPKDSLVNIRRMGKKEQPEYEIVNRMADSSITAFATVGFENIDFEITNVRHDAIKIDINKDFVYVVYKDGSEYKCSEQTKLFPPIRAINPARTVYISFKKPRHIDRRRVEYIILTFATDDITVVLKPIEYLPSKDTKKAKVRNAIGNLHIK